MKYQIYDPVIEPGMVFDAWDNTVGQNYSSNPTIVWWQGLWWSVFDATPGYVENANFQHVWMRTSADGVTWSEPFKPFRDPAHCTNPFQDYTTGPGVPSTGTDRDAQACLTVVGDELWCLWWSFGGPGGVYAQTTFFSRLTAPGEKWVTKRFEFDGLNVVLSDTISNFGPPAAGHNICPSFEGRTDWSPAICGPAIVLSRSADTVWGFAFTAIPSGTDFPDMLKRVGIMRSNPDGTSWSLLILDCSAFANEDGRVTAAWEPFLVENQVGHLTCFVRRINLVIENVPDQDAMAFTTSYDRGATFPPVKSSKMLVADARGYAEKLSPNRWLMTHCDCPGRQGRRNGALFFSRRGGNDFIPGVNFTGNDPIVSYPQWDVGPDGKIRVVYGSGVNNQRKSIRLATIDPPPSDDVALVSPRSLTVVMSSSASSPTPNPGPPPYYAFDGKNNLKGVTPVTATTGCVYAAWVRPEVAAGAIIDARKQGTGGGVLLQTGFGTHGLAFASGFVPKKQDYFVAAVIDNTAKTVTQYLGDGAAAFTVKTAHFNCVWFAANPVDGDTLTVDGTTFTFRTEPSAAQDVQIGSTAAVTITNLQTKLTAVTSRVTGDRLVMTHTPETPVTVTSGSTAITVEGMPLTGGVMNVGFKYAPASSVTGWDGKIYDARFHNTALTEAGIKGLYNAHAADFGYTPMTGATTPGNPTIVADPANPNTAEFPPFADPPPGHCETAGTTMRVWGDGSASVELPYAVSRLTVKATLGGVVDRYVVATFGSIAQPATLTVADTKVYCGTTPVGDVVGGVITITADVYTDKIRIGEFEKAFEGKPRCFLGHAWPSGTVNPAQFIDYDVSAMSVERVLQR